ncbi:MAG: hypothetical protein R2939_10785 [Kofleriaceae bacterium]
MPHGPLREEFPDVFVVTGAFRMKPGVTITRNMTIARQGTDLVVLNAARLTEDGERALAALGTVRHVVRLGAGHGADDAYYAQRFGVPVWAPAPIRQSRSIADARELTATSHPLGDAHVLPFTHGRIGEAAVVLPGGVLVSCDAFQHWTSFEGCSLMAKLVAKLSGFGPTVIGPMWLKHAGPEVARDFEALAELPFQHLVPGHGAILRDTAKDGLRTAMRKAKLATA